MIALLSSLVINSPWFALKNFFFTGACLLKTSLKILKKASNSKLYTPSFDSSLSISDPNKSFYFLVSKGLNLGFCLGT